MSITSKIYYLWCYKALVDAHEKYPESVEKHTKICNHIWWKFCPTCPSFSLFNIEIIKQVSTDERRTMFAQHHLMSLSTNWELKTENKIVSILFCFLFWTFVGVISLFFLLYNWCISLSLEFVIWGNGFSSSVLL